jgi:hypothetical protein
VTPDYIASKLSLLPQFEVVSLDHRTGKQGSVTFLKGYFSPSVGNYEQGANLFLPDLRFLDGLLAAANDHEHLRTIKVDEYSWSDIYEREVVGANLAFFSNYDARRLKLVLDPDITWSKVDFQPRKAIQAHIIGTDGQPYTRRSVYEEGRQLKEGESIVEGAWNHEHCIFCWNTINSENIGYNSKNDQSDEWVCEWCYSHAVQPHDPRPLLTPYKDRAINR